MKKRSVLYTIAVVAMVLSGCSSEQEPAPTADPSTGTELGLESLPAKDAGPGAKDAGCAAPTKVGICEVSCGKTTTVKYATVDSSQVASLQKSGDGVCATGSTSCCLVAGHTDGGKATESSVCTNFQTDSTNCGACGVACSSGTTCVAGACVCPTGETKCGSACVTESSDSNNCGGCGVVCPAATACVAGACVCPAGEALCGSACVTESTDVNNCGSCGNACASGDTCVAGVCTAPASTCAPGLTSCGADCVNTQSNLTNCGSCGNVCPTGDTCALGVCGAPTCPQGDSLCNGTCIPTQGDLNNCGGCGIVCPTGNTCQQGVCQTPPAPGGDLVVFNDINPFDSTSITDTNNQTMVQNLVDFATSGARSTSTVVMMSYGHGSKCFGDGECSTTVMAGMFSIIEGAGLTVQTSTADSLTSIDPSVKIIFLWNPLVAYTLDEINAFKQFATDGGRLVFIGEWDQYYTETGITLENNFLVDMGALMTNTGGAVDCGYNFLPQSSLRPHEITTGMTGVEIACASVIIPGPHDYPIYYDSTNTNLLAGVAAIDKTLFPEGGTLPDPPGFAPAATTLNPNSSTGM